MTLFKKKQIFKSWVKAIKEKQDYKMKYFKAQTQYQRSMLRAFRIGCLRYKTAEEQRTRYQNE